MQIDFMPVLIADAEETPTGTKESRRESAIGLHCTRKTCSSRYVFKSSELPKIKVRDPVTHDTWEHGKFTTFQICLRTTHPSFHLQVSAVRRRFSELRWLDAVLRSKNQGHARLPQAPPKQIFSDRYNTRFLKRRAKAMQEYLNQLLHIDLVLSDNAFHLFTQTDLTTAEMDEYFNGSLPEKVVAEAWANMGNLHVLNKPPPEEPQEIVMNEEDIRCSSCDCTSTDSHSSSSSSSSTNATATITRTAKDVIPSEDNSESKDAFTESSMSNGSADDMHVANMHLQGIPATSLLRLEPPPLVVREVA